MMQKAMRLLVALAPLLLCQCVTTEMATTSGPPITVEGTLFFPDESNRTYIIPAGAEIVGAGGTGCRYIVKNGGKLCAHSGSKNSYRIEQGGHFKGFTHPASHCRVEFEPGATIEIVEKGPGVTLSQIAP